MQRWITRLLVLVMVIPALGPLALSLVPEPQAPHCMRQQTAKPVMECHGGMTMTAAPPASNSSFGAVDSCCQNHGCCRGMTAPHWAQEASQVLSHHGPAGADVIVLSNSILPQSVLSNNDSARAPPRN